MDLTVKAKLTKTQLEVMVIWEGDLQDHWSVEKTWNPDLVVKNPKDVDVLMADWFNAIPETRKDGNGWKTWHSKKTKVPVIDIEAWTEVLDT